MQLRCELKKLFSNKLVIAIFLICLVVNAFVIYKKPQNIRKYENSEAYRRMYDYMEGEITKEKVDYISNGYNTLLPKSKPPASFNTEYNENYLTGYESGDFHLYKTMYEKIEYIEGYNTYIEAIRDKAKDNVNYYHESEEKTLEDFNNRIYLNYENRELKNFYRTDRYMYYFDYSFSNLLILIVIVIALSPLFAIEREEHMSELIITSRHGKMKTFINKLLACIIVGGFVAIIFTVEDFVMFYKVMDLRGLSEPVYMVEGMCNSMFGGSIMNYIVIKGAVKLCGALVISIIVMLASVLARTSLSAAVYSVLTIVYFIIRNKNNCVANVIRLFDINDDAKTYVLGYVFGYGTAYIYCALITSLIFGLICILFAYMFETKIGKVLRRERING